MSTTMSEVELMRVKQCGDLIGPDNLYHVELNK